MKTVSVISKLRKRFPGTWKYEGHGCWSRLEGGQARLCGTIDQWGELGGPCSLYYYPEAKDPILVD